MALKSTIQSLLLLFYMSSDLHFGPEQPDVPVLIIHYPTSSGVSEGTSEQTSEPSGAREWSTQCGASKLVSGASERRNGGVSGPVLTSEFMAVLNHRELDLIHFLKGA